MGAFFNNFFFVMQRKGQGRTTLYLLTLLAGVCCAAILVSSRYLSFLLPQLAPAAAPPAAARGEHAPAASAALALPALESVMAQYGSRLPRSEWAARAAGNASAPAPPVFFVTSSRAASRHSPGVASKREEQYASSLGSILALGYQVYLTVTFAGEGARWELIDALAAAAPPGQLRVHYCSNATRVSARTAGPDETLCMQEGIEAFFGGCLAAGEPAALLAPPPPCCPAPGTHVIRMSGRYLMAKFHMLHAIWARGGEVDAFVKWGPRWTESKEVDFPQVYTFFLAMRVRAGGAHRPLPALLPPSSHTTRTHNDARARPPRASSSTLWTAT